MTESLVLLFCLVAMLAAPVWLILRFSRGPLGLEAQAQRAPLPTPTPPPPRPQTDETAGRTS